MTSLLAFAAEKRRNMIRFVLERVVTEDSWVELSKDAVDYLRTQMIPNTDEEDRVMTILEISGRITTHFEEVLRMLEESEDVGKIQEILVSTVGAWLPTFVPNKVYHPVFRFDNVDSTHIINDVHKLCQYVRLFHNISLQGLYDFFLFFVICYPTGIRGRD